MMPGLKGEVVRYLKQFALPVSFIVLGITTLSATASSPPMNETVNYSYDELGRLVKVEDRKSANNNVISNYAYDKAGNRTNVKVTGAP
jgi:YD repeat-containing protein